MTVCLVVPSVNCSHIHDYPLYVLCMKAAIMTSHFITAAVFCYRQIVIKCWTKRRQKEWITYLKDVASNQGEWSHLLFEHSRKCRGLSLLCVWKQQCCHHTVVIFRTFLFLSMSYLKFTYLNVKGKGKAVPITGLEWPRGFQEVKVPRFHDNGTGWW